MALSDSRNPELTVEFGDRSEARVLPTQTERVADGS